VQVEPDIAVCNLYCQRGLKSKSVPMPFDEQEFRKCLTKLFDQIYSSKKKISLHFPKIGCGLGGASWELVGDILSRYMSGLDSPCYVYTLPPKRKEFDKMGRMKEKYSTGKGKIRNTPKEIEAIAQNIRKSKENTLPIIKDSEAGQADLFGVAA
jgi:hypothetical protein